MSARKSRSSRERRALKMPENGTNHYDRMYGARGADAADEISGRYERSIIVRNIPANT